MAETNSTQETNTTSSHVTTLTIVAQVVGTLLAAYGAVLTAWAESHSSSPWPGVVVSVCGMLSIAASHYGYVKGQTITQNGYLDAIVKAAASPIAVALIMGLVTKKSSTPLPVVAPVIAPVEPPVVVGMPADRTSLTSSNLPK
jgi:drug/metabolite transporter (DMT)-like permease